jgi:hypothetical protein
VTTNFEGLMCFHLDVRPLLQGVGVEHLICWRGKNVTNCKWVWSSGIASILCLCIIFKNPSDVSAQAPNFIPQSFETKSLYHLLEIEQEITLLLIKE